MIAVYARQSIDKKDSDSIETQIEKCVRTIDDPQEHVNYTVYQDRGYSGSNLERPDFKKLIHDIEAGTIRKVIVYKVDRFSRSLVDFYNVYRILEKHGVDFISLNDNFDTSTATGRAMLSITLVFAQLERETIALRVKDNYYARARQGRALGGKTHYGYRKMPKREDGKATNLSVPDEAEHPQLLSMFRWYDEGLSLSEVCSRLRAMGVPAPMGGEWESAKVSKILHNPFYVRADVDVYNYFLVKGCRLTNDVGAFSGVHGLLLYGKRDRNASKYRDLTDQFVSLGLHEGAISPDQWLRVQKKLEANESLRNSGKSRHTWLSGLTKCGACGYAMTFVAYREGRNYLNCRGKTNYRLCVGQSQAVFVEDVEEIVEASILDRIQTLAHLAACAPKSFDGQENKLKMQLVEAEKEYEDYMDQLRHADDYLREHIARRLMALEDKRKALGEELRKRRQQCKDTGVESIDATALVSAWSHGSIEDRKRIAARFLEKVIIRDAGGIEIVWLIPP